MRVHPASSIPNEPFEALASKTSRCGGADQREKTTANCAGIASFRRSAAQNRPPSSKLNREARWDQAGLQPKLQSSEGWSGRWESNPRHSAWEADVLPLNYARAFARIAKRGGTRQGPL